MADLSLQPLQSPVHTSWPSTPGIRQSVSVDYLACPKAPKLTKTLISQVISRAFKAHLSGAGQRPKSSCAGYGQGRVSPLLHRPDERCDVELTVTILWMRKQAQSEDFLTSLEAQGRGANTATPLLQGPPARAWPSSHLPTIHPDPLVQSHSADLS